MARNREPVDVLIAKGKKHLTKEEIETRKDEELVVPFTKVKPPKYLDKEQKKKFKEIADKLLALGIMTELDVDCLARYLLSETLYLSYTDKIAQLLSEEELDLNALKDVQNMQDKVFRQAHTAARALCMTITDRCKMVVPAPVDDDDEL